MRMLALNTELETSKDIKCQTEDVVLNAKLINGGSERHNWEDMEALNELALNTKLKRDDDFECQTEKNDSEHRTEKDDFECRNWEEIVALNAKC